MKMFIFFKLPLGKFFFFFFFLAFDQLGRTPPPPSMLALRILKCLNPFFKILMDAKYLKMDFSVTSDIF